MDEKMAVTVKKERKKLSKQWIYVRILTDERHGLMGVLGEHSPVSCPSELNTTNRERDTLEIY